MKIRFRNIESMKKNYIMPECKRINTIGEGCQLLAGTGTPTVKPGTKVGVSGEFEFIHEGTAGDDAESKQHHYWDVWDD